jgi:general secretion pathway protein G
VPTYQRAVAHARETVLKENLWQMRKAIDQYTADKGKMPKNIDDLIQARYLKEKPVDPILEKADWQEVQGDDPNNPDDHGLQDVKSTAQGSDSEGVEYSKY